MVLKKYLISATAMTVLAGSMVSQPLAQNNIQEESAIERTAEQSGVSITVSDKTIKKGTKFNPKEGVTAKDYNGKNITNHVIVTYNNVNPNQVGVYKVGYAVLGSNGKRVDVQITVKVISNENEEFKTVINAEDMSIKKGTNFDPLKGIKATDISGADITRYVLVTKNEVKTDTPGIYDVTYLVLDTQGNRVSKTIKVTVLEESNTPEVEKKTVIDVNDISINKGTNFNPLKGVKAIDISGADITRYVLVTKNDVKTDTPGIYDVTYLVLDTQGNRVSKTIKVTVVGESSTPEVEKKTEIIANDITLNTGDVFKEKDGVKAIDVSGLDITKHILVTKNNVNTNRAGDYEVTYLVLDTQGNRIYKTIKVKVVGDPIITDEEQAQTVKEMIELLKDESLIELSDEAKVIEAREAYEKLSEEAKLLVTNIDKLEKIETKLKIEKDKIIAKELEVKIASLKDESLIELEDEAVLVEIREAYNNLSPEAKILVASIEKLETAETKLAELKKIENDKRTAKEVEDKIASLDRQLEYADKIMIDAVRKEYEALSPEAKLLVPNLAILERVEQEIEVIFNKVTNVISLINALPEKIELTHKAQVEEARTAYDALDENEKKGITKELLSILTSSELKIKELEAIKDNSVANVEEKINNLPEVIDVQYSHEDEIKGARQAYDLLSPSDKLQVSNITKLEEVEAEFNRIKEGIELVTSKIHQIPELDSLTLENEQLVIDARNAYDLADEKITYYVDALNYQDLIQAEAKIKNLKDLEANPDAKALIEKIEMLLNKQLTEADRADVEGLRPAYELLSTEGKKLIIFGLIEELEMRLAEI